MGIDPAAHEQWLRFAALSFGRTMGPVTATTRRTKAYIY